MTWILCLLMHSDWWAQLLFWSEIAFRLHFLHGYDESMLQLPEVLVFRSWLETTFSFMQKSAAGGF